MKTFFESIKAESVILIVAFLAGSLAACTRLEKVCLKKVAKEILLSNVSALITYSLCRWIDANEWLIVSLVAMASYTGSRTLPFFEWLAKSAMIKVTEKRLGIDLDDKDEMK